MLVEAQVPINGSRAAIWAVITDIENSAETISGIEHIEVLERPAHGLVRTPMAGDPNVFRKIRCRGKADHGCR